MKFVSSPPVTAEPDSAGLFPKVISDTRVTFNGIPAPLLYVSNNQINCVGALGLLLMAKQKGKINEVTPYIRKLRNSSIHYGEALLERVIKLAGE